MKLIITGTREEQVAFVGFVLQAMKPLAAVTVDGGTVFVRDFNFDAGSDDLHANLILGTLAPGIEFKFREQG